jgi:two-component sensor histidine kinase
LFCTYQRGAAGVKLDVRVDEVSLDLDQAVPCGLILNELMTNALKYAFPDANAGTIWVELFACPERVLSLRVADDGVGLPADLDIHNTRSLGLQLVNSLVAQMDGSLEVERSGGTAFWVSFAY